MSLGAAPAALGRLDALAAERGIALEHDPPIGPYTTLRVGGPADRLVTARTRDELLAGLALAREAEAPFFVLGNGSDLVVADSGIRGLVIRNRARSVETEGTTLRADGGAAMAMLVKRCTSEGLAGLEFGISIPGSLGGAVWANAGAHGGEMAGVLRAAETWDPADGSVGRLTVAECAFGYRDSRFKHSSEVILSATLELEAGDPTRIGAAVEEHQAVRRATQPLADQNAGSVFRNPAGDHAGRLIEAAGLKGARSGSAQVSTLHANFIVTDRGGSAADVRALSEHVRSTVARRFAVDLEYEIEFVGDWQPVEARS
ncbi:MAG: UDP-N-acetylmuramate dehydrogenase [Chloroflexota bacterium]